MGQLSENDHEALNSFLTVVLNALLEGTLSKADAQSGIAHVIGAIDLGNHDEARRFFANGLGMIHKG